MAIFLIGNDFWIRVTSGVNGFNYSCIDQLTEGDLYLEDWYYKDDLSAGPAFEITLEKLEPDFAEAERRYLGKLVNYYEGYDWN